jgi:L-alanine-DL-glutamate epimerase-like enolase superfamily enzyme
MHDDQGNIGLGETFFSQSVIEEYVHKIAAPIILNTPLINPELMNFLLRPYVGFQGGGIEVRAIGGLDIALWDLWGKRRGATLSELLGGQVHNEIDVYNTCAGTGYMSKTASQSPKNWGLDNGDKPKYDDLNGFLHRPKELARDLLDSGITGMKIWPFDFAAERTKGTHISNSEIEFGLKIVSGIREEVGMDMNLMIELHALWNRPSAEIIMNS